MFGNGCQLDHLGMEFAAGTPDEADTWACPYCHLVFKKLKSKKVKPKHGSHIDATD